MIGVVLATAQLGKEEHSERICTMCLTMANQVKNNDINKVVEKVCKEEHDAGADYEECVKMYNEYKKELSDKTPKEFCQHLGLC